MLAQNIVNLSSISIDWLTPPQVLIPKFIGYQLWISLNLHTPRWWGKIAFITKKGMFCYKSMLFGLKNARATYQWMVNKVFKDQLGRIMKGYVDDILVKRKTFEQHLMDLEEVFYMLSHHQINLTLSSVSLPLEEKSLWVS